MQTCLEAPEQKGLCMNFKYIPRKPGPHGAFFLGCEADGDGGGRLKPETGALQAQVSPERENLSPRLNCAEPSREREGWSRDSKRDRSRKCYQKLACTRRLASLRSTDIPSSHTSRAQNRTHFCFPEAGPALMQYPVLRTRAP